MGINGKLKEKMDTHSLNWLESVIRQSINGKLKEKMDTHTVNLTNVRDAAKRIIQQRQKRDEWYQKEKDVISLFPRSGTGWSTISDILVLSRTLAENDLLDEELNEIRSEIRRCDDTIKAMGRIVAKHLPCGIWLQVGEHGVAYMGGTHDDPRIATPLWTEVLKSIGKKRPSEDSLA